MTERDWVPCHRRLLKGAKKGWPRAARFIFLELCHEARPTDGVLEFPVEWDTLTAVHDRLGGNRKEIRVALEKLQEPDATRTQVVQIERDQTKHRLIITKWETWSGPKSGAERVELHRKRALEKREALQAPRDVTPTGSDSTGKERRGSDARAEDRSSERRLKSVPPPKLEPSEAEPPGIRAPPTVDRSEDAAPGNLGRADGFASGDSEPAYDLARRLWSELWAAKYRRPYDFSPRMGPGSEDYVLQRVGESATIRVGGAEAYLRHKFGAYLRDHGKQGFLDEECHPLRCLERDWAKYGEPKEPRRMVPRREEPPVELVSVEEMAARAAAAMTLKVGSGGT